MKVTQRYPTHGGEKKMFMWMTRPQSRRDRLRLMTPLVRQLFQRVNGKDVTKLPSGVLDLVEQSRRFYLFTTRPDWEAVAACQRGAALALLEAGAV